MTQNVNPQPRGQQTGEAAANEMDRPLPGSDDAVPGPNASGVAEPIEAAEEASGVDPGRPTPTQKAQMPPEREARR